ncbi:MAG: ATP-binding cassette domain-containing protein [Defluviitaleaceae bacterium]|nr:ATP-binding cassette domain-containing protein [Defluviitaleaceae bacterium]
MSKKYGGTYALDDINIEIKRGQVYGLIGLNGSGKTTFMRGIMGLIALNAGEVELFGKTGRKKLQRERCRIGQCIETPALHPNRTAKQNLRIQQLIAGITDNTAINKTLDMVGLSDVAGKKTKHFSYGMKQRLALAVALVTHPEFLILDEPANGLDPKGIIETRNLIRRINCEMGVTVLVSSHMLDELSQVATHYGIIDKGKIIKQFSAEELAAATTKRLDEYFMDLLEEGA